jgi:hypothetical protein
MGKLMIPNLLLRQVCEQLDISGLAEDIRSANCPFCERANRRMLFYSDAIYGFWYCCPFCNRCGSLVDLLRYRGQLSTKQAQDIIAQYLEEKVFTKFQARQKYYEDRDSQLAEVWKSCQPLANLAATKSFQVQLTHGCQEFLNQSDHILGLDEFIRACTANRLATLLKTLPAGDRRFFSSKDQQQPEPLWFVTRTFRLPGLLGGLLFFRYVSAGVLEHHLISVDPDCEPGIAIHPATAVNNRDLVLISDLHWFFTATLWQSTNSPQSSAVALYFDQSKSKTNNVQMLVTRRNVVWGPADNSLHLRMAAKLNCPISTFGGDRGKLSSKGRKILRSARLFQDLQERSVLWQEVLAKITERDSLPEIQQVVKQCELNFDVLRAVELNLERPLHFPIEQLAPDHCPLIQLELRNDIVEQTPSGWYCISAGKRYTITNRSWRIVNTIDLDTIIEVYQEQAWRQFTVSTKSLQRNASRAIADAMIAAGSAPLLVEHGWQKSILFLAYQFNPPPISQRTAPPRTAGFDSVGNQLVCNRLAIKTQPAEIELGQITSREFSLFPAADGAQPSRKKVADSIGHFATFQTLSAIASQAARYLLGLTPLSVTFGRHTLPAVSSILSQLQMLDKATKWPCRLFFDCSNKDKLPRAVQNTERGIWLDTNEPQRQWLAATRPVFHISDRSFAVLDLGEREFQRLATQLIFRTLLAVEAGLSIDGPAIEMAWRQLVALTESKITTIPAVKRPLDAMNSIVYWTQQAINLGALSIAQQRFQNPKPDVVYKSYDVVSIPLQNLNTLFKDFGLARWDLSKLLPKLALSPYYQNTLSRYRRTWLQIGAEAFDGLEKPPHSEVAG